MRRRASADAVFKAFDDKISAYLDRNRASIEKEYRQGAGRGLPDSDVSSFMSGLGDSIYDEVHVDQAHLSRFVDFYLSDDKLSQLVSKSIDASREYPRAASSPSSVSDSLRRLAASISGGPGAPDASSVASSIRQILDSVVPGRG